MSFETMAGWDCVSYCALYFLSSRGYLSEDNKGNVACVCDKAIDVRNAQHPFVCAMEIKWRHLEVVKCEINRVGF